MSEIVSETEQREEGVLAETVALIVPVTGQQLGWNDPRQTPEYINL